LAEAAYVVAVCSEHDLLGDGEHFTFDAMRHSPAGFLAAFDRQVVDGDHALRAWLVSQSRGEASPSGLLTVAEAGKRENVSERTIQRWIEKGELKAIRLGSGPRAHIRIEPAALEDRRKRAKPPKRKAVKSPTPADLY
jgi:excisionase family DNA binding protein